MAPPAAVLLLLPVLCMMASPGQPWVFLGSLLLVAGVYFMLFVRERRAFVLIKQSGEVLFAMSANRKTLDFETAFQTHRDALRETL